jgi:hypothetical protein
VGQNKLPKWTRFTCQTHPGFRTNVIDVGAEPSSWIGSSFDYLHYHVPREGLELIADDLNVGRVEHYRFAINEDDLLIAQITKSIVLIRKTSGGRLLLHWTKSV